MQEIASRLTRVLNLDLPPVALRFVQEKPADVQEVEDGFPSPCSLWRAAESRLFYAPAAKHHGCAVGTMVMGFPVEQVSEQLSVVVTAMAECGYLSPDEAASIPTVAKQAVGIVYGPLAELAEAPDAVLIWADAKQLMVLGEAAGSAAWTAEDTVVTGRPGCAVLPRAMNSGAPAMSVGCIGMRTFTRVPDNLMPVAIPGVVIGQFVGRLEQVRSANESMRGIYQGMLDDAVAASSAQ